MNMLNGTKHSTDKEVTDLMEEVDLFLFPVPDLEQVKSAYNKNFMQHAKSKYTAGPRSEAPTAFGLVEEDDDIPFK